MAEDHAPGRSRTVAFLPWADRFEDFHDRIGISLEDFRDRYDGTWLFNYVEALQSADIRPVLYFVSARVPRIARFTHKPTGVQVRVLPAPWLHRKLQGARDRFRLDSPLVSSAVSYAATPWAAVAREMRRDRCDAILCHEYEYPRFDQAVVLGRTLRMPVFATYQGGRRAGSALERPFRGAAIRGAAGIVIGARAEIERVRSAYGVPAERTTYVPNAFDVRRWRPADRRAARIALSIPADMKVITWQGRVEMHRKGLDVLLDAWGRLCAGRPGDRLLLLLVGSGRDEDILRGSMSASPPGSIRWDNQYVLDRDLLWRYLSSADIATLPSRDEGFAVSVIEAMACGLPVVATSVSGVAEALGADPTGVIVPPENAAALAEAFGRLLDDAPRRRELGARARRRAEEEFSLETVGERLRSFMEARGAFRSNHDH